MEVSFGLLSRLIVEVSRRERDDLIALVVKGFEFRSEVDGSGSSRVPSLVESRDTDRVSSGDHAGRSDGSVDEDEREHSVEEVAEFRVVFLVLWTGPMYP